MMYDPVERFQESVDDKKIVELRVIRRTCNILYISLHAGSGSETHPFVHACITSDTQGYAECLGQLGYNREGNRTAVS